MQKKDSITHIMENLSAIILDMDGVLVDTEPIHLEAFRIFLEDQSLKYTEKYLKSFIGYSIEDNIHNIIRKYNLYSKLTPSLGIKQRDEIYFNLIQNNSLSPNKGVYELINYCSRAKIDLALASSSSYKQINTILTKISKDQLNSINFFNVFSVITSGDEVKYKKPNPEIYELTLSKLKKYPSECIAVEDSIAGIQSSMSAGLFTVGLSTPYVDTKMLKKSHWQVDSILDVVTLIYQIYDKF